MKENIFEKLREHLAKEININNLLYEKIIIRGKTLSTEEAIGNPERRDFPLLRGKESLIQAEFKGYLGQAFTDSPGNFAGNLQEFIQLSLNNNYERACFIAVLNAVMSYLGKAENTIHCKDDEPNLCAGKLVEYLQKQYKKPKIGLIGFQPALLEYCSRSFPVRIVDLNPDNIGQVKHGVTVENGDSDTEDLISWSDVILITGSTLANNTIGPFLEIDKPVYFYGTTIAGAAKILGLQRFCPCSR